MAEIKKISTELQLLDKFLDTSGDAGTSGQILSSTATGINWVSGSAIPGVPGGSGTLNTVAMWTPDGDTLGDGPITFSGNNSTFTGNVTTGANITAIGNANNSILTLQANTGNWVFTNVQSTRDLQISDSDGTGTVMTINTSGDVGIGVTGPVRKLDVAGITKTTGFQNTNNYVEGFLFANFANGVANQNYDIQLGNISFWGYIEVEITGTYSNQNTAGKLTKIYAVGVNPATSSAAGIIYTNETRVSDSIGTIKDNIALGNFRFDGTDDTGVFAIRVSHIVSTGNGYTIKVRVFTHGSNGSNGAAGILTNLNLSSIYTQTALSRQYVYYNYNVGIGTTNPSEKLQVDGAVKFGQNSNIPEAAISHYTNGYLYIKGGSSGLAIGNNDYNANIYLTNGDAVQISTSGSDRMIINSSGNVGIGTTSPTQKLHLDGNNYNTATRTTFLIRDVGNNYDQGDNAIDIVMRSRYWSGDQNTSQNSKIRHLKDNSNGSTGTQLRFSTTTRGAGDSSDKMTILASGNVGIGTSLPRAVGSGYKGLEVSSTSSGSSLWLSGFSDTTKGYLAMDTGGLNLTAISNHSLTFGTNNSPKMTILSGGNVGIGTTSPVGDLSLYGGQQNIVLTNTAADGVAGLTISRIIGQARGYSNNLSVMQSIDFETNSGFWYKGDIVFKTNNTDGTDTTVAASERMRIKADGSINIGSRRAALPSNFGYSGSYKVLILGSSGANYQTDAVTLSLGVDVTGNPSGSFTGNGREIIIRNEGSFISPNAANNGYNSILSWNSSGQPYFSQNVGIGSTSPRGKLQINGNGNSWNDGPSVRLWDTTNSKGWLVGNVNNYTAGDFYIRTFATVNTDPTSASQEFTIKHATGNVGIGTTGPDEKLTVNGITRAVDPIYFGAINTDNGTYGPYIESSDNKGLKFDYNGNTGGEFQVWNHDQNGGGAFQVFNIDQDGNVGINITSGSDKLTLKGAFSLYDTNAISAVIRLNPNGDSYINGGDLGVGITLPQHKLDVGGTVRSYNYRLAGNTTNPTTTAATIYDQSGVGLTLSAHNVELRNYNGSSMVRSVFFTHNTATFTGTCTATNFILSSDKALKDNIREIDTKHIDVEWKNFELKSEPGVKRSGVIAQELEKKHPEFVRTNKEGLKSVAYVDLLIAKIAELEARLEKAGI